MKKGPVHAELQRHRSSHPFPDIVDQLPDETLRAIGVMHIARAVFDPQDMAGLCQMRQNRIVRGILAMMRVKASIAISPSGSRSLLKFGLPAICSIGI